MSIIKEKKTVERMIGLYCRYNSAHNKVAKNFDEDAKVFNKYGTFGSSMHLCEECQELLEYCLLRLDKCPFGDKKGTCRCCKIHCYKPEMREKIRTVMRFSGPRLILLGPMDYIRHFVKEMYSRF